MSWAPVAVLPWSRVAKWSGLAKWVTGERVSSQRVSDEARHVDSRNSRRSSGGAEEEQWRSRRNSGMVGKWSFVEMPMRMAAAVG